MAATMATMATMNVVASSAVAATASAPVAASASKNVSVGSFRGSCLAVRRVVGAPMRRVVQVRAEDVSISTMVESLLQV